MITDGNKIDKYVIMVDHSSFRVDVASLFGFFGWEDKDKAQKIVLFENAINHTRYLLTEALNERTTHCHQTLLWKEFM